MFKSTKMRKVFKRGAARKFFAILSLALMAFSAALITADTAWAEETDTAMPWEEGLATLQESITGPVAQAIALIAIVAAGAALIFGGDMTGFMRTAVYIVLVLGIIISASNLLGALYGESALLPLIL